ncbi:MAG: ABC transporter permease [Vicinamibacterales bacterium]
MRDWPAFVRARLPLQDLAPERAERIVREMAAQLEDFHRDALARGLAADEADAYAQSQVADWSRMASDLVRADRPHRVPRFDRFVDRLTPGTGAPPSRSWILMHLLGDVRYAIRQLLRNPGFALVATLTLALGIGATTAIFSVVNGVLLRPLPYGDPDALVRVHEVVPQYGRFSVAPATFLDWRSQNQVFDRMAAYGTSSATWTDQETPDRLQGAIVSWDLFQLLGVAPELGGSFTADQDLPDAPNVVVISHTLWQQRFGGSPDVVGRTVPVNGVPTTIVGVMPAGFYFPSRTAEFWTPIGLDPSNAPRGAHFLGVVARLRGGVTATQADAEMRGISERLAREYPDDSANESSEVVPLLEQVVGGVRTSLLILLAAVGVVVLIACANVANLLLVRASVREKEVAIRTALGAGRRRLVLQMLAESLVLAVVGGAAGLALAWLAIQPIQALGASSLPRVADIGLDGRVLGFAGLATIVTGVLFGLAPAWHAARGGIGAMLKDSSRSSTAASGRWIRRALLVAEVALSIVLLVGAALLLRSFARLTHVDPGFQPDRVLTFSVSLPQGQYPDTGHRAAFYDRLLERLAALPGATAAGMAQTLPLRGNYVLSVEFQGRPPAQPGQEASANYRVISPDYFTAMGIPLRRGRTFTARDSGTSQQVAVVDEAFVRRHFPDEDPIGHGLDIGNGVDGDFTIVGVVGDVRQSGLDEVAAPTMYVPYAQDVFRSMSMVVRTDGDPAGLARQVREAVRDLDGSLPAYGIATLASVISDSVAQPRFSMLLLSLFAGIALFLAAVGLYGVVAYTVSQRTREIGLRMAIGAQPRDVLRMVVGDGMRLAAIGVAVGLVAAALLARVVQSMLFEVETSDPASYGVTALVLLAVAAIACYVPARRAMRVDPLVALQSE